MVVVAVPLRGAPLAPPLICKEAEKQLCQTQDHTPALATMGWTGDPSEDQDDGLRRIALIMEALTGYVTRRALYEREPQY